jgi:hypothetical protein
MDDLAELDWNQLLERAAPFLRLPELRHLPGKHDQSSHGKGGGGAGGIRDALAGAQSTDELNAAAAAEFKRITGRDIAVDMTGSDLQLAKEHMEGLARGMEAIPNSSLRTVRMGDVPNEAYAMTSMTGSEITFSHDAQKYGADSYRQDLKFDGQSGDKVTGSPAGVAAHEYGHSVANTHNLNDLGHAVQYPDLAERVSKEISHYAATNSHEMVAEGFADIVMNGMPPDDTSSTSRTIFLVMRSEAAK